MLNEILQWVGDVFIIAGVWYVGEKKRFAFLLSMIGNGLWLVYCTRAQMLQLGILASVFIWLSFRNWQMWRE
jgi:hypothetical protein